MEFDAVSGLSEVPMMLGISLVWKVALVLILPLLTALAVFFSVRRPSLGRISVTAITCLGTLFYFGALASQLVRPLLADKQVVESEEGGDPEVSEPKPGESTTARQAVSRLQESAKKDPNSGNMNMTWTPERGMQSTRETRKRQVEDAKAALEKDLRNSQPPGTRVVSVNPDNPWQQKISRPDYKFELPIQFQEVPRPELRKQGVLIYANPSTKTYVRTFSIPDEFPHKPYSVISNALFQRYGPKQGYEAMTSITWSKVNGREVASRMLKKKIQGKDGAHIVAFIRGKGRIYSFVVWAPYSHHAHLERFFTEIILPSLEEKGTGGDKTAGTPAPGTPGSKVSRKAKPVPARSENGLPAGVQTVPKR